MHMRGAINACFIELVRAGAGPSAFCYSPDVRNIVPSTLVLLVAIFLPFSMLPQQQPGPAPPAPVTSPAPETPAGIPAPGQKPVPSTPALTVVLDPAHGGPDAGARGATGVVESEMVLDFARAARTALESRGLRVLLTREGNQDPSFDDRSSMVNGIRNAIFISLHVSSTGPIGTVRVYSYDSAASNPPAVSPAGRPLTQSRPEMVRPPASVHPGLVLWDRAQESHLANSQRLAALTQTQLAQKFAGSPDAPQSAAVRQLRTIAAPAIAIEVSSVAVSASRQLEQMTQPLGEAVARAVADFQAGPAAAPAISGNGPGASAGGPRGVAGGAR